MLYFGVESPDYKGHFLNDNSFQRGSGKEWLGRLSDHLGYKMHIDGGFCPNDRTPGIAKLTYTPDFTILSIWDYSGDPRPGSHSTFIEFGRLTFSQMLEIARITFPAIFGRFDFQIKLEEKP